MDKKDWTIDVGFKTEKIEILVQVGIQITAHFFSGLKMRMNSFQSGNIQITSKQTTITRLSICKCDRPNHSLVELMANS
jgi:hypothetical protein